MKKPRTTGRGKTEWKETQYPARSCQPSESMFWEGLVNDGQQSFHLVSFVWSSPHPSAAPSLGDGFLCQLIAWEARVDVARRKESKTRTGLVA